MIGNFFTVKTRRLSIASIVVLILDNFIVLLRSVQMKWAIHIISLVCLVACLDTPELTPFEMTMPGGDATLNEPVSDRQVNPDRQSDGSVSTPPVSQDDAGRPTTETCGDGEMRCKAICAGMFKCLNTTGQCPAFENAETETTAQGVCVVQCQGDTEFQALPCDGGPCDATYGYLANQLEDWAELCGGDSDGDGVSDAADNCILLHDPDQADSDDDGVGDLCDRGYDYDQDTIPNTTDNCPWTPNTDQADEDGDGIGDLCGPDIEDRDLDTIIDADDNCPISQTIFRRIATEMELETPVTIAPRVKTQSKRMSTRTVSVMPALARIEMATGFPMRSMSVSTSKIRGRKTKMGTASETDATTPRDANPGQINTDGDSTGDVCDPILANMHVELEWGFRDHDFDLHLLNADGIFFRRNNSCNYSNRRPAWCRPGLTNDAPREEPATREQIRIAEFIRDEAFTIGVDLRPYDEMPISQGAARINIYCAGQLRHTVGPVTLRSELPGPDAQHQFWDVGRITTECTFEPTDVVRTVVGCDQTDNSCVCVDCLEGICRGSGCREDNECERLTGMCPSEPEAEGCDGLDNDQDGTVDEGVCACQTIGMTRFTRCNTRVTRAQADAACRLRNQTLATHVTPSDLASLALAPGILNTLWVGLTDVATEGTFLWDDGTAMTMTENQLWSMGEPNDLRGEDCVVIGSSGLNDVNCESSKSFLCADPPMGGGHGAGGSPAPGGAPAPSGVTDQ